MDTFHDENIKQIYDGHYYSFTTTTSSTIGSNFSISTDGTLTFDGVNISGKTLLKKETILKCSKCGKKMGIVKGQIFSTGEYLCESCYKLYKLTR